MPPAATQDVGTAMQREELQAILQSPLFTRSPTLTRLLSYLCEKVFRGEADQIKEYSVAVDVFGRGEGFDQEANSIVRVEVNRLRKRLAEYYNAEDPNRRLRLVIPVGQYVPVFEEIKPNPAAALEGTSSLPTPSTKNRWLLWSVIAVVAVAAVTMLLLSYRDGLRRNVPARSEPSSAAPPRTALPALASEIRILAGSSQSYIDHSGKLWSPDSSFEGGTVQRNQASRVWRTQDPAIYRSSRQGDFAYNIPLKPGIYELRLHFAEMYYGPGEAGGGGEGSRTMNVSLNDRTLLSDFDVLADAGGSRTADVKVFTGIEPASDGQLHLRFSSASGGPTMLSAIEIVPGISGRIKPIRVVARDVPYYSNDSEWWAADTYFRGGQFGSGLQEAAGASDPDLYETERWGHFSYAIPVTPGQYTVVLHFIEHRSLHRDLPSGDTSASTSASDVRVFDVFCNGQRIVNHLNIADEAGENRALLRTIRDLQPNAQGKLLLEFVPVSHYATVSAIEVLPQ